MMQSGGRTRGYKVASVRKLGDTTMKKLLLGLLATSGICMAAPAMAADYLPPEPVPTVYDWSGFYVGAHLGYGWGDSDNDASNGAQWSTDIDGIIGGLHLGYNFQIDSFVIGLEGDFDLTDIDGSDSCPNAAFTCSTDIDYVGTVRGRLGFAIDQVLLYGTGGVAFTKAAFANDNGAGNRDTKKDTEIGFVAGGGIEFAAADNFTVRVEGLYYDFNGFNFAWSNDGGVSYDSDVNFVVVRAGFSYNF